MPTYTVHAPPLRNGAAPDPQRFVFVRDGFHFWAFLLAPLWLLYRRLWLVLIGYLLVSAAMEVVSYFLDLPEGTRILIGLLVGLLIGLEAATLRRWTYGRRRWRTVGVVTGDDAEAAEQRFFAQWVAREPKQQSAAPVATFAPLPRAGGNDIIGLFPEPGGRT
jgi:hypothetical protein